MTSALPTLTFALVTLANATPPATPTPAPGPFAFIFNLLPFVLLLGVMYFILIAPQRRKQKEQRRLIESVQKGARVTTIGGLYGTVVAVEPEVVVLKVDETSNTKVRLQKAAIASVIADDTAADKKK